MLGYGAGFIKFANTMLTGPMGADPILFTAEDVANMKVDYPYFISKAENIKRVNEEIKAPEKMTINDKVYVVDKLAHAACCWHLVNVYRKKNTAITTFWYEIGPAVLEAMAAGEEQTLGPLKIIQNGLVLPSGLVLRYPELAQDEDGQWTYTGEQHGRIKAGLRIYGGLLLENIVQALSRIIVSDQLLAVRSLGHKVVLMTHDEIVALIRSLEAAGALEVILNIMRLAPEWAEGLPLSAEGGHGPNYGEAKS